ncbi:MAG: dihydropteroate synthase [candidate division Zixibacteria bacterium]|nr:dihydropteroate synthase [candidate division Zixibacteria bacterium]
MNIKTSRPETSAQLKGKVYDFHSRTYIMGVLNVTPDSFSDGGRFLDIDSAIRQGISMAEEGADIIDVGGESTRPGSEPVPAQEEIKRIIPVITELASRINIPISVDTYKAEVARKALSAGAEIINDISALRFDPEMADVAKEFNSGLVLMHMQGNPKDMQRAPVYNDVLAAIRDFFTEQTEFALSRGIDRSKIILDPGIGFGKTTEHNLRILQNLSYFKSLKFPLLIGVSRKSLIGNILNLPSAERLEGSLAGMVFAIQNGANIVRVHDVRESVRAARVIDRLKNSDGIPKN